MRLSTIFSQAFRSLGRHWIQSSLSVLGIAVGVAAFICVVAIGNAGTSVVEGQLQNLGDNFIWVEAGSRNHNGMRMGSRGTRSLVMGDAEAILAQVPMIKRVVPNVDGNVQVIYGNQNWATRYRGVTPDYLQVRRWDLKQGEFFNNNDVATDAPVCVLGQTVVDNLFDGESPVGKTMRMQGLPCRIVGTLRRKGFSSTGWDQDDFVLMPYTTAQKRIRGTFWIEDIYCSAVSRASMKEGMKQITALLRERHHLNITEDNDFNIRRPEDLINAQLAASKMMRLLLASVASLSLLVGGIGIMNIMLVSVTQRTREIGIHLAIGATESDVQLQFLSEAVFIAAMGAAVGVVLGMASANVVPTLFDFPTELTNWVFGIGAGFAAAVGIIFGYYPARKAAQLDPIQALRYE